MLSCWQSSSRLSSHHMQMQYLTIPPTQTNNGGQPHTQKVHPLVDGISSLQTHSCAMMPKESDGKSYPRYQRRTELMMDSKHLVFTSSKNQPTTEKLTLTKKHDCRIDFISRWDANRKCSQWVKETDQLGNPQFHSSRILVEIQYFQIPFQKVDKAQ